MKLSQLPNRFEYHDSIIDRVEYDSMHHTVRVEVELLLYMQEWFDKNTMPDSTNVVFEFSGASDFELEDGFTEGGEIQYIEADDESHKVEFGFYYEGVLWGFLKFKAGDVEILDYAGYDEV